MMRITGMETPAGKAAETAYRAMHKVALCNTCDGIGKEWATCQCGSLLLPARKPPQIQMPLWC
jgi:hypothetical protein